MEVVHMCQGGDYLQCVHVMGGGGGGGGAIQGIQWNITQATGTYHQFGQS